MLTQAGVVRELCAGCYGLHAVNPFSFRLSRQCSSRPMYRMALNCMESPVRAVTGLRGKVHRRWDWQEQAFLRVLPDLISSEGLNPWGCRGSKVSLPMHKWVSW